MQGDFVPPAATPFADMVRFLYRLADRLRHRARRKRGSADLTAGRFGEDLAHRFLQQHGFTIVARNYRPLAGSGEIDLIGWEKDYLAFIEVKTRATDEFGTPDRAVDAEKQKYMGRAARDYARRANVEWERTRFDIVSIVLGPKVRIQWFREAFRL